MKACGILSLLAGMILGICCARADDSAAFPSQTSSDGRIKVTLLYVGPITDPQIHKPFVVMYMIEDCRTPEELTRHPWKIDKTIDQQYYIAPSIPELRDGKGRSVVLNADERARGYTTAATPFFKSSYPQLVLPPTNFPDSTGIYEYFMTDVPEGPLDITLHDSIPAYHANSFRFREVEFSPRTMAAGAPAQ